MFDVIFGYQISSREPCSLDWHIVMKNHAIKCTGIQNRLKILSFCVLVFFPFRTHAQSITPEQEVLGFYKKYMIACAQFINKPKQEDMDDLFCGVDIKKYITKSLFEKIVRSHKSEPEGDLLPPWSPNYLGDSDYFLHIQDFDAQWASSMSTRIIHKNKNMSVVRLFMDFSKDSGESLAICVRLQRDKVGWKFTR